MRFERGRTKKLIVAFHFELAHQAGWKCGDCRKNGLESKRRCGWLPEIQEDAPKIVWARGSVFLDTCPKSFVTADSTSHIRAFAAWKLLGGSDRAGLTARTADAFCVLENELRAEMDHGTD